jgi:ribosomal protein L11 methyltransferase
VDWIELSAVLPGEHVEELCAALRAVTPGGCSIEDPIVPLGPEEGVRHEPWRPSTVRVYLPADSHLAERRALAHELMADLPFAVQLDERPVREEDWANGWKEFFQVERIGNRLVVQPTWREYLPGARDVVLHLDPGMAFGTGQHETTRMCLIAVEETVQPGMLVLDLGCGSGILAIAAARLGAKAVDALDVESVAVEATTANAVRNDVQHLIRVAEGSLGERWPFGTAPVAAYDVGLANIHAAAAIDLAPALHMAIRAGGLLVVSGIIAERLDDVLTALYVAGFISPEVRSDGAWRAVLAHKPAGAGDCAGAA